MPYITRDFPIEFVNAIVHKEGQGKTRPDKFSNSWLFAANLPLMCPIISRKLAKTCQVWEKGLASARP